jgi:hypothetical protein
MTTAVLLPLRLETRFTGNRLRVRVIPDEPWYDRHDPQPSAAELADLERYLTVAADRPERPEAQDAWRVFAGQHGPGRAVWLVRTFPLAAGRVARPAQLREDFRFTDLTDFPEQLEVWLARGGEPPALAATMPVDATRLRLDPPDRDEPDDQRWWESWDEAVRAGLATEIEIDGNVNDIDALYVVGLGTTTAAALFAKHRDAGQLGLLAPGTPTNTVDGEPAADLGTDPMPWLELLGRGAATSERQVSLALTGDRELLGPLPGDPRPFQRWARVLLTGLWPALLGHTLSDVLGLGRIVDRAASWAADNVDPLGPYPTLRIGSQPYGLLPATSLVDWVSADDDPVLESALRASLVRLRRRWAVAANLAGRGAIQGATAERLLELLAQPPASPGYALRRMHPIELWHLALTATNHAVRWPHLVGAWRQAHPVADDLGLRVRRRYGSRGGTRLLRLPPVTPRGLPDGETAGTMLRRLVDLAVQTPSTYATTSGVETAVGLPVDSLLLRLAIRSIQVALGDLGRDKLDVPPGTLQPIAVRAEVPPVLAVWIRAVEPEDLVADTDDARAVRRVTEALRSLTGVPAAELERLLPASIDCASHRIDPWVVGFARRRLRRRPEEPPLLGAYGWVDRPRTGQPGPTGGRLLHAPSHPQALTAALIRDRALSDPEPDRWHMDVTSDRARRAARLADEVRRGAHPAEALGREVERAVADPPRIRALRQRFPLRDEHAGRRTCDGLRVLAEPPGSLDLPAATLDELARLREAVDVYGDLLVAEAVHHVVEGRAGQAGAALDAAAGLARPPVLDVLQTRREGRPADTSCLVVIRDAAPPPLPDDPNARAATSPALLADPASATFLESRVGGSAEWRWRLTTTNGASTVVSLANLGLDPADALALPLGVLERLVRATVDGQGAAFAERDGSIRYERAARLVTVLGRTPATGADTVETNTTPATPTATAAAELLERLTRLRATAQALADRLSAATGAGEQRAALRLATRWGIAPEPDPTGPVDPLAGQVDQARRLLLDRLATTPDGTVAGGLDPSRLAAALAALASPTGQIAVLGRLRRDALPALEATGGLDVAWLAHVAPVRVPLARLEALQFAAGTPVGSGPELTPWTNRPTDPWQTSPDDSGRLVVAYAPGNLDLAGTPADRQLAVGLLDRFAETIPSAEHTTTAAFGFDAPGARAPQAILLAVPPDPTRDLDPTTLVNIVAETRELARARMATLADLGDVAGLAPLPLIPATGDTAGRLER